MIPVWIDTDCGVDDAYALIGAFSFKNIDVVGVSSVCGNVANNLTFKNARNVLALIGKENIPVYKGADGPMMSKTYDASYAHGNNGLGGVEIPDSKAPIEKEKAIDALYKKAKELKGELRVAAIGPLTNIAEALFKYPDLVNYIKELVIMGGSVAAGGNITMAAEFNIYADAHAAQAVFKSGLNIVMFGLDVTKKVLVSNEDLKALKDMHNKVADFGFEISKALFKLNKGIGYGEIMHLHDTCPIAYLSDNTLFKGKQAGVYVETMGGITYGKTISDIFVKADELFKVKNVKVMLDVDSKKVVEMTIDSFKGY